jgi:hypothetical protein
MNEMKHGAAVIVVPSLRRAPVLAGVPGVPGILCWG